MITERRENRSGVGQGIGDSNLIAYFNFQKYRPFSFVINQQAVTLFSNAMHFSGLEKVQRIFDNNKQRTLFYQK